MLLPLLNVPMIEYTLEWLAMNNVEEVRGSSAAYFLARKQQKQSVSWLCAACCVPQVGSAHNLTASQSSQVMMARVRLAYDAYATGAASRAYASSSPKRACRQALGRCNRALNMSLFHGSTHEEVLT